MKRLSPVLALICVIVSGFFAGVAFAADYIGSGQFTSGNLNWCHTSEAVYNIPNQNAVAKWSAVTDLNLISNCSNYQIRTSTPNWGDNGLAGKAYICMTSWFWGTYCDSGFNDTFISCNAQSNQFYLSTWNDTERQFNATHELGHCWSLAHRSDATSVMQQGKLSTINPNTTDINLVNIRY